MQMWVLLPALCLALTPSHASDLLVNSPKRVSKTTKKKQDRVAFLFLVRDTIYHQGIWREFFKQFAGQFSIYVHTKSPPPVSKLASKWTRFFLRKAQFIQDPVATEWKNFSLVRAQNRLLSTALKSKTNQHFVFLSEACLPVKHPRVIASEFLSRAAENRTNSLFCMEKAEL
jgi:hypothetical protein